MISLQFHVERIELENSGVVCCWGNADGRQKVAACARGGDAPAADHASLKRVLAVLQSKQLAEIVPAPAIINACENLLLLITKRRFATKAGVADGLIAFS